MRKRKSCPAGKRWMVVQGGGRRKGVRGYYTSKIGAKRAVKRLRKSGRDPGAATWWIMRCRGR